MLNIFTLIKKLVTYLVSLFSKNATHSELDYLAWYTFIYRYFDLIKPAQLLLINKGPAKQHL